MRQSFLSVSGSKCEFLLTQAQDAIELSTYNEEWPQMAKLEIRKLLEILPKQHVIDIQHVGSTAIPGMSAKPVIDIQIAVDSLNTIKSIAIKALKELGYEYWDKNPDPERLFTHHIHIVEPSSRHWQEKILFRDYLRAHPEARLEYEVLKNDLARQFTYDREQ